MSDDQNLTLNLIDGGPEFIATLSAGDEITGGIIGADEYESQPATVVAETRIDAVLVDDEARFRGDSGKVKVRQAVAGLALVGILGGGIGLATRGGGAEPVAQATPGTEAPGTTTGTSPNTTSVTPETNPEPCAFPSWEREVQNHEGYRFAEGGVERLTNGRGAAQTEEEAREDTHRWLDVVFSEEVITRGTYSILNHNFPEVFPTVNFDQVTLFDAQGCATEEARELRLATSLGISMLDVQPIVVPADATNTGIDGDNMTQQPGVHGDEELRRGVSFTYTRESDGAKCTVGFLYRCTGNMWILVTTENCIPEIIIFGKTDNGTLPGRTPANQDPGQPETPPGGPRADVPEGPTNTVPGETLPPDMPDDEPEQTTTTVPSSDDTVPTPPTSDAPPITVPRPEPPTPPTTQPERPPVPLLAFPSLAGASAFVRRKLGMKGKR